MIQAVRRAARGRGTCSVRPRPQILGVGGLRDRHGRPRCCFVDVCGAHLVDTAKASQLFYERVFGQQLRLATQQT